MGLIAPVNTFLGQITNMTGRPVSNWGTLHTPGFNTYAPFTQILGPTAFDTYYMRIIFNSCYISGAAQDTIAIIGIDYSGGTTYTDLQIQHLLLSSAGTLLYHTGVIYDFPLYIPAGSTIAVRGSQNKNPPTGFRTGITLYGRPTRPELVRTGSYVDTYGANPSTSSGTPIISGTTSEGVWTQIGSTTTRSYWWFQTGLGCNDSTMTDNIYALDLAIGDTTNRMIIYENELIVVGEDESVSRRPLLSNCYFNESAAGQRL
jgi:hypothetical protein